MKLKVMFLIPKVSATGGGTERQVIELVRGLDKKHLHIFVVSLYDSEDLWKSFRGLVNVEVSCLHRKHKYDVQFFWRLIRFLRAHKIDVIQLYLTPAVCFGMLAALLCKIPVKIVTERGTEFPPATLGGLFYSKVEDFLTRFADMIIANSEAGRTFLLTKGLVEKDILVIHNGVSSGRIVPLTDERTTRKELGIGSDVPVVGIVATLTTRKDYETFLRASQKVSREFRSAKFLVVGDGPLRSRLENLAEKLGLGSSVIWTGARSEVASIINVCQVAVLSSQHTEGCPNFILEAMGMSKPVVATDVGGSRELVVDGVTGRIVPKRDPTALAEAVSSLLRSPEIARRMGVKGKERFRAHFTLDTMLRQYEALYDELRERRAGARSVAPAHPWA